MSERASYFDKLEDKGLITSAPRFIRNNIHYEVIMGSFAYGVTSDTSDMDVYGFCIPPKDMIFPHLRGEIQGFGKKDKKRFEQFQQHKIMDADLKNRLIDVEKKIFDQAAGGFMKWDETVLKEELDSSGFSVEIMQTTEFYNKTTVSDVKLNEWFDTGRKTSYVRYLSSDLSKTEIEKIRDILRMQLSGKIIDWRSSWLFVKAVLRL